MKKLLTVFTAFVLVLVCTFSVYSVSMNIDADSVQSTKVIKANVNIKSDSGILSGKFSFDYDSSFIKFRGVSSSDFIVEVAESELVFVSKSGAAVKDSQIKLEFERMEACEVVLSIDSATFVDESKKTMSADSVSTTIILEEKSADISEQGENSAENASADSLVLKGDLRKHWKPIILFSIALMMVALIVFVKINKEKNCADSK